ncbi:MAG: hypothetical protein ACYC5A_02600 [Thermoleophilia bacterium]
MPTESEIILASINQNIFFSEFSFAKNKFTPQGGSEVEFADHVIKIDDLMMVYQAKQRNRVDGSAENEEKWFKKEVLGTAAKQVRDTAEYLESNEEIVIENQRGHKFNIGGHHSDAVLRLIIYVPAEKLPTKCLDVRYHRSSTVGFIHILTLQDYSVVCGTLVTPGEVVEYFMFRQEITEKWRETKLPSETALIGQYLHGGGDEPSEQFTDSFIALDRDNNKFDISHILSLIGDRQDVYESEDDYYDILAEFAKLTRGELQPLKERIDYCLQCIAENKLVEPRRVFIPKTECGFIFLPLTSDMYGNKMEYLKNMALACKYDLRIERQIGVSFINMPDNKGVYINWFFVDAPWLRVPEMDKLLEEEQYFRPLRDSERQPRYRFNDSE